MFPLFYLDAMAQVRRVEDTDRRSMDVLIQQKAGELSAKHGVEIPVELVDGETKRVLCGAVERLHAGVRAGRRQPWLRPYPEDSCWERERLLLPPREMPRA